MNAKCLMVALIATGCAASGSNDSDSEGKPGAATPDALGQWCHVDYTSVEGTAIQLDYQIAGAYSNGQVEFDQTATPLWLNVSRGDLASASAVHVWIGDQSYISKEGYATAQKYGGLQTNAASDLDLARSTDATRFTGQLAGGLAVSNYTEGDDEAFLHAHQLAVVIDDVWQTDPISGSHNFLDQDLEGGCNN